jgi:hypothetical protein
MPCPIERAKDSQSIQISPTDIIDPAITNLCCNLISIGRILDGYGNVTNPLLTDRSALYMVAALHYLTNKAIAFVLRHETVLASSSDQ